MELSEQFYMEFGAPMIHEKFPEYEDKIAVGLVGEGSNALDLTTSCQRITITAPAFICGSAKKLMPRLETG